MTITVEMMRAVAERGFSIVCASCEKYWEARGKNIPGDLCTASDGCGGPLAGGDFHEYRGLMTADAFRRFCFVCGAPTVAEYEKRPGGRRIGMCAKHFPWMQQAHMRDPRPLRLGVPAPKRNPLLDEMLATEQEWAEQDGREFDREQTLAELSGAPCVSDSGRH